jgi:MFS family permease
MSRFRLGADLTPLRSSRDFRILYGSRTVAQFGTQATEVALLVQAKQLTGSALAVGLLGAAEVLPLVVFGLYGGVLADRGDRRRVIRRCEAGLACCAVLLTLNAGLPHPSIWPLYALTAVMMAMAALQRPSLEASIPRVVPREQLTAAAALLSMSQNASVILGTTLGGVLAAGPGPGLVYGLDTVTFTGSLCLLMLLRPLPVAPAAGPGGQPGPAHESTAHARGIPPDLASADSASADLASADVAPDNLGAAPAAGLRGILTGLRYARGRKDLLGSYLADLSAMIFAYPNALFPFIAVSLHATWSVGLMFAAPSVGAFAVTVLSGWMGRIRRHGLAIALAAGSWGVVIIAFGLAPNIGVALACLVVAGAADMVSGIFRDTLWNQTIPDHLRGRLAGVELLSYGVGPSAGQVRAGAVASLTTPRFSLVSGGLLCIGAVGAICLALPSFTGYRAQVPSGGASQ